PSRRVGSPRAGRRMARALLRRAWAADGAAERSVVARGVRSTSGRLARGSGGERGTVLTIRCDPELHPAVLRAAGELRAAVEAAGIPASPPRSGNGDGEGDEEDQI